jgi:hypothetical protein
MAEWHIPEDLLVRFLRLETPGEESRQVVRHLLSQCPQCSDLAQRVTSELGLFDPRQEGWERAYEQVFNRVIAFAGEEEQRLAVEKLRGWAQWAELEPLAPQLRFVAVESTTSGSMTGSWRPAAGTATGSPPRPWTSCASPCWWRSGWMKPSSVRRESET